VTPNTIAITVAAADVTSQNIFNEPVAYLSLNVELDPCCTVLGNLVTDADDGTFGGFPAGTAANTGTATNPYPAISPDFIYVEPDSSKYTPIDGEFTMQNIMNNAMSNVIGAWWRISDHTSGNETGRMMIVNEDNPVPGGIEDVYNINSNPVFLLVEEVLADRSITKRADRSCAMPCQRTVYTIAVTNNGPGAAEDVVLRDCVPAGLMQVAFSLNGGYNLPTLASGARFTI